MFPPDSPPSSQSLAIAHPSSPSTSTSPSTSPSASPSTSAQSDRQPPPPLHFGPARPTDRTRHQPEPLRLRLKRSDDEDEDEDEDDDDDEDENENEDQVDDEDEVEDEDLLIANHLPSPRAVHTLPNQGIDQTQVNHQLIHPSPPHRYHHHHHRHHHQQQHFRFSPSSSPSAAPTAATGSRSSSLSSAHSSVFLNSILECYSPDSCPATPSSHPANNPHCPPTTPPHQQPPGPSPPAYHQLPQTQSNTVQIPPSITLCSSPPNHQYPPLGLAPPFRSKAPQDLSMSSVSSSSSLLPQRFNNLYSRLKPSKAVRHLDLGKPSRSTNPSLTRHHSPPSPQTSPPSLYGFPTPTPKEFRMDPDSWVSSEDSDDSSDDEPGYVRGRPAPTSPNDDDDRDEVPLSKLCQSVANHVPPSTSGFITPPTANSKPNSEARILSKVLRYRSSRSLRSLYRKPEPTTAPPSLPPPVEYTTTATHFHPDSPHPPSHAHPHAHPHPSHRPANRNGGSSHPATNFTKAQGTLRAARSSPSLSHTTIIPSYDPSTLAAFPIPPTAPLPSVRFCQTLFTPTSAQYLSPSSNNFGYPTPPSSISPPLRSQNSNLSQSSITGVPIERDIYKRMRKRHQEQLQLMQQNFSHLQNYDSLIPPPPLPPAATNIDPSLYSMLSDSQKIAIRQRSKLLNLNLKLHLESLAREMIQSNIKKAHQHQQQRNGFI